MKKTQASELSRSGRRVRCATFTSATGEEGLADVRVIEALHRSAARDLAPIALGPASVPRRPRLKQVVDRPAHPKPKRVHARSASGS